MQTFWCLLATSTLCEFPIAALTDYHKLKTPHIDYLTGLKVKSLHGSQWGQIKVSPRLCRFQEAAGKNPGFCPFLVLEAICIPGLVNPSHSNRTSSLFLSLLPPSSTPKGSLWFHWAYQISHGNVFILKSAG